MIFITFQCNGQWLVEQSNVIGGTGDENFNDVIELSDGYLAVGYTTSSNNGDIGNFSEGASDFWVVRFDSDGNIIWEENFGGIGNDVAHSVVQTANNDFWVFGTIDSSGNNIEHYFGEIDGWGIKLNADGALLTQQSFGGDGDDLIKGATIDNEGNIYLAGQTNSGETVNGTNDAWMFVIDDDGNIQLSQLFGGSKKEGFNDIVYNAEQNLIYAGGFTNSDDGDISEPPTLNDTWLLAIDASTLDIFWEKTWGGSSAEIISDITQLSDGSVAFIGETGSDDITGYKGIVDVVAGVYDKDGTLQWARAYGGTSTETSADIVESSNGRIALLGYSNSIGADVGFGYQSFNVWLSEVNADNGDLQLSQLLGGNRWDFGACLLPLVNSAYFLLANTDSFDGDVTDDGDGKKNNSKDGNHDIWIAKLNSVPTNNSTLNSNETITIFPNPSEGIFNIETEQTTKYITVYDSMGKLLFNQNNSSTMLNMSAYTQGIYYIEIQTSETVHFEKLIKKN